MNERDIYRILVTGSRAWPDILVGYIAEKLAFTMSRTVTSFRTVVLVHGDCTLNEQPPGTTPVDQIADRYVRNSAFYDHRSPVTRMLDVEAYPANWDRHGRAAGPFRNDEMVSHGARRCLAFPDETAMRGTSDCFMKAIRAGIPTEVYPLADARRWLAERRAIEAAS
jgi:hypothetical protein